VWRHHWERPVCELHGQRNECGALGASTQLQSQTTTDIFRTLPNRTYTHFPIDTSFDDQNYIKPIIKKQTWHKQNYILSGFIGSM
jgi:hypothetical protein